MAAHPAKYSAELVPVLRAYIGGSTRVLDPMAGVGTLGPGIIYNELEWEWVEQCTRPAIRSDATRLPFRDNSFDCAVTSPAYGNRMADNYAGDPSGTRRYTYRIFLGRPLDARNGARYQYGPTYKDVHIRAWREVYRVLEPGGKFIINLSDHIRADWRIKVTDWHITVCKSIGFVVEDETRIETPRNRHGANGNARVEYESVFLLRKRVL